MSITTYTDLELRLQAENAELKAEHIDYIGRTGARILALHEELGELKADNETLRVYAKHERSQDKLVQEILGQEPVAYMLTTRNFGLGGETWDTTEYRDYLWDYDCVPLYTKGTTNA